MNPALRRAERIATYGLAIVTVCWVMMPISIGRHLIVPDPITGARLNLTDFILRGLCMVWAWSTFRWRDMWIATTAQDAEPPTDEAKEQEQAAPPPDATEFVVDSADVSYAVSNFALERNLPPGSYTTSVSVRSDGSARVTVKKRRGVVEVSKAPKPAEQKPN